jgi:hypothetical protein
MFACLQETEMDERKGAVTTMIKSAVTDPNFILNTKFGEMGKSKDGLVANIAILSNEIVEPIRVERIQERRFFVVMPVSNRLPKPLRYRMYAARAQTMPQLLWHLQNDVDMTGFDPHEALITAAFRRMVRQNASDLGGIVARILGNAGKFFKGREVVLVSELYGAVNVEEPIGNNQDRPAHWKKTVRNAFLRAGVEEIKGILRDRSTENQYILPRRAGFWRNQSGQARQHNEIQRGQTTEREPVPEDTTDARGQAERAKF